MSETGIKKLSGKTTLAIAIEKRAKPIIVAKTIMVKIATLKSVKLKPLAVGTDLAKLLNLPMNFFDLMDHL